MCNLYLVSNLAYGYNKSINFTYLLTHGQWNVKRESKRTERQLLFDLFQLEQRGLVRALASASRALEEPIDDVTGVA